MECPHCRVSIHPNWASNQIIYGQAWLGNANVTRCPACEKFICEFNDSQTKFYIVPRHSLRSPPPSEVPQVIAADYIEAATVLPYSPKASAALSRRCLQNILTAHGYQGRDLMKQVAAFINESDPAKVAPQSLRDTVDAIRNFGNFSAHPIDDKTTLQILDVEEHEAEWCLDILDEMFEHFYVRPAQAVARKAALNAKLGAAGKPAAQ